MNQNDKHAARRRAFPSAGPALAAGTATAALSLAGFVLWSVLPAGPTAAVAIAVPFILAPVAAAAAAWIAAQRAVQALLDPMVEQIKHLSGRDALLPVSANAPETMPLAAALERYRAAMAEKNRTGKVHSAVARLLGAGIGRLAEGDYKARITVDLPDAYRPFQDDFNRAMERLEADMMRIDASEHAAALAAAADQLGKRAEKLAARIEADLQTIAVSDPTEALQLAQHTLGGTHVAAKRNVEAAARFREIAEQLGAPALTQTEAAAPVPASIGNAALKLEG